MNTCISCKWLELKIICPFMQLAKQYPLIGCKQMYLSKNLSK